MALSLSDIAHLFAERGDAQYSGEPVSQRAHALQSAALGEADGASDALVTAALLHDLGHLVHELGATPSLQGVDDVHQYRVLPYLRGLFSDEVLGAIRLHVDAKPYLCAVRPGYLESLSADSVRSLALQGGRFSDAQAEAFLRQPGADAAVRVRVWDDLAKTPGLLTPPLSHFLARAQRCALSG